MQQSVEAVTEDGVIAIRVPVTALGQLIEGAWCLSHLEAFQTRWKLTDPNAFAKDLVYALNHEDEQGTTAVHRMFDAFMAEAIEGGAEGIVEHEDQEP